MLFLLLLSLKFINEIFGDPYGTIDNSITQFSAFKVNVLHQRYYSEFIRVIYLLFIDQRTTCHALNNFVTHFVLVLQVYD